jgi:hypothetical protein
MSASARERGFRHSAALVPPGRRVPLTIALLAPKAVEVPNLRACHHTAWDTTYTLRRRVRVQYSVDAQQLTMRDPSLVTAGRSYSTNISSQRPSGLDRCLYARTMQPARGLSRATTTHVLELPRLATQLTRRTCCRRCYCSTGLTPSLTYRYSYSLLRTPAGKRRDLR